MISSRAKPFMLRGNCFTIGYFHKMLTKLTIKCWLDNDPTSGNMLTLVHVIAQNYEIYLG